MSENLNGFVALITGGSSGMGFEMAKQLLSQGATVIITARAGRRLDDAEASLAAEGYDIPVSTVKAVIDTNIILTMNAPLQYYKQAYESRMQEYFAPMRFLNGQVRIFPVCDTLQVKDYSKYDMTGFSEEHKKAVHDAEFPTMLDQAFKIGANTI